MVVDKTTTPNYVTLYLEDGKRLNGLLKEGRVRATENRFNEDGEDKKTVMLDLSCLGMQCGEYYFDENEQELHISFTFDDEKSSFFMTIPLTDLILIDILGYSVRKLNKLKQALESLK